MIRPERLGAVPEHSTKNLVSGRRWRIHRGPRLLQMPLQLQPPLVLLVLFVLQTAEPRALPVLQGAALCANLRTLNLAFRDGGSQPAETTGKASDLVFVAPRSLSRTLLAALAESHDVAHLVWWPFVSMAGQSVHFIDDERQGSSMIGVTPFVSFVGLRRDCDNYNQTCARGKRPRVADEQVHLFRSAALSEPSAEVMVEALWSDELNGGLRALLHARPSPPTNNPLTIQHLALAERGDAAVTV